MVTLESIRLAHGQQGTNLSSMIPPKIPDEEISEAINFKKPKEKKKGRMSCFTKMCNY